MTTLTRNGNNTALQQTGAGQPAAPTTTFERKVKPVDRLSTARLDDLLPADSPLFELLAYERQIDNLILQKQMRIADAAFKGPKIKRILRVTVWNTAHDQEKSTGSDASGHYGGIASGPYAIFAVDHNEDLMSPGIVTESPKAPSVPSWTLRVEGKLEAKAGRPSVSAGRKFTSFLRSIIVEIGDDNASGPTERDLLEWHRKPGQPDFDGFEVKRRGSQPVPVRILIDFEHQPERFKLSPALSALLGLTISSKPHIILAMWRYVKLNKLQESDEKKVINCDKALRELFNGAAKCTFSELPTLIEPHLSRPDPLEISYCVHVDKEVTVNPFVYEVEVDIDDPSRLSRSLLSSPVLYNLQVDLDSATARQRELADALRATLVNHTLLSDFARDPVATCRALLRQQCADVHLVTGETRVNYGDLWRADRFTEEDVETAVADMVASMSETSLNPST